MALVHDVRHLDAVIVDSKPKSLVVLAIGSWPFKAGNNPKLVPYVYVAFPGDGIWDFNFIAESTGKPDSEVMAPITACYTWVDFPEKLKGIRVHTSSNKMEIPIISDGAGMEIRNRLFGGEVGAALVGGEEIPPNFKGVKGGVADSGEVPVWLVWEEIAFKMDGGEVPFPW